MIFNNRWIELKEQIAENARQKTFKSAYELLVMESEVFKAINSGAMKYRWFIDKEFSKIYHKVLAYANLQDSTGELADEWALLWPKRLTENLDSIDKSRAQIIKTLGEWAISQNFAFRLYLYWLALKIEDNNESFLEKVNKQTCFNNCKKWGNYFEKYNNHLIETPIGKIASKFALSNTNTAEFQLDVIAAYCKEASASLTRGYECTKQFIEEIELLCGHLHFVKKRPSRSRKPIWPR